MSENILTDLLRQMRDENQACCQCSWVERVARACSGGARRNGGTRGGRGRRPVPETKRGPGSAVRRACCAAASSGVCIQTLRMPVATEAVVGAGDWASDPPRDRHALLQPFSRLRHPVWGVLGNHDTGAPGPPLAQALRQALQDHGVQVLDGRRLQFQGVQLPPLTARTADG